MLLLRMLSHYIRWIFAVQEFEDFFVINRMIINTMYFVSIPQMLLGYRKFNILIDVDLLNLVNED